jgi:hypothetical protein
MWNVIPHFDVVMAYDVFKDALRMHRKQTTSGNILKKNVIDPGIILDEGY